MLLVFFVVHMIVTQCDAGVFRRMGLDDLVRNADAIFVGTCVGKHSSWNEAGTQIGTEAEFIVEENLKGAERKTVPVRTWG